MAHERVNPHPRLQKSPRLVNSSLYGVVREKLGVRDCAHQLRTGSRTNTSTCHELPVIRLQSKQRAYSQVFARRTRSKL